MNAFVLLSQAIVPDHAFCMRMTIVLVHLIWQGLAIAALSLTAARLLRQNSADLRYAVHVTALALLALCLPVTYFSADAQALADRDSGRPPTIATLPADRGGISAAIVTPGNEQQMAGDGLSTPQSGVRPIEKSATLAERPECSDMETAATAPATRLWLQRFIERVAPYATAIYFLGVLFLSLRLMLGLWGGHRLRRSATPVADPGLIEVVRRQARKIGLRFVPVVAWCQRVSTPIVVGIVTPAILLPAALAGGLTPDQLSALLTHELAHIRRFDLVLNLLQRVIETLLFFHPAVWYLSRQISRERENCCDDFVLATGWHGADYAEALLRMGELCFQRQSGALPVAGLGAAGERPSEFKRRVLRLVGVEDRTRLRLSRPGVIALGIVLIASLAVPALTYPRGSRETEETAQQIVDATPPQIATDGAADNSTEIAAAEPPAEAVRAARPGLRIYGKVFDASTGKPVAECRVVPAPVSGEDSLQYTWQPQYRKKFDGGAYEWKTDRPWEMTRLRIEAPGYRPAVSRAITSAEGEVEIDVKLFRDEGIMGVVLTPDGQPAAEAQLALATWTFEVQVREGELRQQGHARDLGVKVVYTDEAGRFRLPPEVDPAVIVVAHETGYAEVDVPRLDVTKWSDVLVDEEQQELKIKLVPWGRVEGRVLARDKPIEGAKFWVGSGYTKRSDLAQIHVGDDATTDADGRFVVERVPPGRGWCQRYVPNKANNGSHAISGLNISFDIPAGETVELELGGGGRTVVGRIQLPEAFLKKLDWTKVGLRVFPRAPHIGFPGDNEMWQSYGEFLKTEEGQAYYRDAVEIAADGSFRIEALPPADYQVVIHVPGAALAEEPRPDGSVAQGGGNFKIAPIRREGDDKALDVGAFRLLLAPEQPTKKENAAAKPERPAGTGEVPAEWGINRNGIRTRLVMLTDNPAVGQPLKVKLEIRNSGAAVRTYRFQKAYAHTAFRIKQPNGKPAEDIIGPAQIQEGRPQTIKPGETVTLIEEFDLAAAFLLPEAGKYELSYRGLNGPEFATEEAGDPGAIPESNTVTGHLAKGTLPDFQTTFLRIRSVAPKNWAVVTYHPSIIIFPPNFKKVPGGHLVHLKFSKDELPADASPAGNQPPLLRLGLTKLGHAYLSVPAAVKVEWPECVETIREQLPRDVDAPPVGDGQVPESRGGDGSKANAGPMQVALKLDRAEFLLGESIAVAYEVTNRGKQPVPYGRGGIYPDLRWNDGFRMSAVRINENGKPIGNPVANWPAPESHGGKSGHWKLAPGESRSETLFVTRVVRCTEPGRYRLRIENIDRNDQTVYSAGETILTLKAPTPEQAQIVFLKMKRAPREAYDDREMTFLGSAADFQTMYQPVYLPILREFALKGDVDALPSLAQMESLEANEVLVAGLVQALDNDDWDTARTFYLSLHSCLPFPNWYDEENGAHDKSNRERVARTWKAEFGPVLTRLARRLGAEVALELRRVRIEANSAPGLEQLLLGDIDYIYRCLGQPDDLADCMNAYAQSIELTKTLRFETHQYFRPRGSASGFGHTVFRMMQRGAQAPTKPAHPGEAATFAIALRTQRDFRPAGWEAEVMKWLKAGPPYLAEVILDHLPDPIPEEVLGWLPAGLASDYIDLAIAACKIAQTHPRPAYKKPLQRLLETSKEQYLVKFSRAAAEANGLVVPVNGNE